MSTIPTPFGFDGTCKAHHLDPNGVQYLFSFDNGYGASVVRFAQPGSCESYGGAAGLYELAVLDHTGEIDYTTPITSDVLGWLTQQDVHDLLARIASLPA